MNEPDSGGGGGYDGDNVFTVKFYTRSLFFK